MSAVDHKFCFFFQAEDGIRDYKVTGVQTCALPISQLSGLNEVSEALTNVRVELKGLSEKVQNIEQNQNQANQGIASLATGLARADVEIKAMSARVEKVEQGQSQANQTISSLGTGLAQAHELTRTIAEAAEA